MQSRIGWLGGAMVAVLLLAGGCRPVAPPPPTVGWYGPTEPVEVVIARINDHNARVPSLWARLHEIDGWVADDTGRRHFVNADGTLMMRKPRDLLLRATKPFIGMVFEVGSTSEEFWLTVPEMDTHWWGRYDRVAQIDPRDVPVRPDMMFEILGVSEIAPDLAAAPAPVLRFNNDLDVYMITWTDRLPRRWYAQREVWYDRQTLHPRKVLLYDHNGRVQLRANLFDHAPIDVPGVPAEQRPVLARRFDLFFPENGSTLVIRLDEVYLERGGFPRPGGIRRVVDPDIREIRIDEPAGN